jgi:hypothetical protein
MAKQPTTLIAVRIPNDLVELIDAAGSRTEVIIAALRADLLPLSRDEGRSPPSARNMPVKGHHLRVDALFLAHRHAAIRSPRDDPGRIEDPASEKSVAQVLPVTGTEFPEQLTYWQKLQLKSKGKKGADND